MEYFGKNEVQSFSRSFRAEWDKKFATSHKNGHGFNPYSDEGGTVAAIAGQDYVIIAGDSRISNDGFNILSRNKEKLIQCNDNVVMASVGFQGDIMQLSRVFQARFTMYKYTYKEEIDVDSAAQMIARTFYYRRFFPYYTGSVVAGLSPSGEGKVFSYDPIGCIESVPYSCGGAGTTFMTSYFDNEICRRKDLAKAPISKDSALNLMRDAFKATAERETSTGDKLQVIVLQKNQKPERLTYNLRAD